jgi:hypothetical protein
LTEAKAMRKTPLQVFALAAVLAAVSAVSLSAPAAPDETLRELAGYRQWASVKGEPGQIKALPDGASVDPSAIAL